MYRSNEELQAALRRVEDLQRVVEDGSVDPVQAGDEIVATMRSVISTLLTLSDLERPEIYVRYVEPLGNWGMNLSLLWMGKEHESRGAALKACFDKVYELFQSFEFLKDDE